MHIATNLKFGDLERRLFVKAKALVYGLYYEKISCPIKKAAWLIDNLKKVTYLLRSTLKKNDCDCNDCSDVNYKHTIVILCERFIALSEFLEARALKSRPEVILDLNGFREFSRLKDEGKKLTRKLSQKEISMNDYIVKILEIESKQHAVIKETNEKIGQLLARRPAGFNVNPVNLTNRDLN